MKLTLWGIALISIGGTGLIIAIVMELIMQEPIYMLVMKVCAGFFGVGGPLLGLGYARRGRRGRR